MARTRRYRSKSSLAKSRKLGRRKHKSIRRKNRKIRRSNRKRTMRGQGRFFRKIFGKKKSNIIQEIPSSQPNFNPFLEEGTEYGPPVGWQSKQEQKLKAKQLAEEYRAERSARKANVVTQRKQDTTNYEENQLRNQQMRANNTLRYQQKQYPKSDERFADRAHGTGAILEGLGIGLGIF